MAVHQANPELTVSVTLCSGGSIPVAVQQLKQGTPGNLEGRHMFMCITCAAWCFGPQPQLADKSNACC